LAPVKRNVLTRLPENLSPSLRTGTQGLTAVKLSPQEGKHGLPNYVQGREKTDAEKRNQDILKSVLLRLNLGLCLDAGFFDAFLFHGLSVGDAKYNTGYTFGLTTTYSIMQHTGLTVNFLFTREGAETSAGTELKLNYLRLPIYFDYFFNELGEVFRPKIYAGIVPGLRTQAEVADVEVDDNFSTFDLGIGGGIGFNYQITERTWLNVDARYVRGIININEEADLAGEAFNQYFQGSVGIAFGL